MSLHMTPFLRACVRITRLRHPEFSAQIIADAYGTSRRTVTSLLDGLEKEEQAMDLLIDEIGISSEVNDTEIRYTLENMIHQKVSSVEYKINQAA